MSEIQQRLGKLGIEIPEILLPQGLSLRQWAVIACDQFTQDKTYWERAEKAAGSASALRMIFPEVFLGDEDRIGRIQEIRRNMRSYLDGGVLAAPQRGARRGFIYLERDTPYNRKRKGLVVAVDLEKYDWQPSARLLIRSTEDTVADRLPPRMDIRRNAPVETTHVILLIDDDADTLLPALAGRAKKNAPAYQGELMLNSGSVSGWFLDTEDDWAFLAGKLEELAGRALTRYGAVAGEQPFLFAVGDGNHSLASAKGIWEEYKAANAAGNGELFHPCRYALVEIENIYDPAIKFEPIHRAVFGLGFDETVKLLSALPNFSSRTIAAREELVRLTAEPVKGNRFGVISKNAASGERYALIETNASGIATASLQPLLDKATGKADGNGGFAIDYIHGEDELFRVAADSDRPATGILLPPVQKAGFFESVARGGPLPRKSFSMGEASEKRFYIECRRLFG